MEVFNPETGEMEDDGQPNPLDLLFEPEPDTGDGSEGDGSDGGEPSEGTDLSDLDFDLSIPPNAGLPYSDYMDTVDAPSPGDQMGGPLPPASPGYGGPGPEPPGPKPPGPKPPDPSVDKWGNMSDKEIHDAQLAEALNNAQIALLKSKQANEQAQIAALRAKSAAGTATPQDRANLARLESQSGMTQNDLQSAQQFAQSLALRQQEINQAQAQFAQQMGLSQQKLAQDAAQTRAAQLIDLNTALTNMSGRLSPTLIKMATQAIMNDPAIAKGAGLTTPAGTPQPAQPAQPASTSAPLTAETPPVQPDMLTGVPMPGQQDLATTVGNAGSPPTTSTAGFDSWLSTQGVSQESYAAMSVADQNAWVSRYYTSMQSPASTAPKVGTAPPPTYGSASPAPRPSAPTPVAPAPVAPKPAPAPAPTPTPFNQIGGGTLNTVQPNPYKV